MEDCKLVAAIDFGTTFSGYAFAFTSKPGEIRINKNWGESVGFQVSIPVLIQAYTCIIVYLNDCLMQGFLLKND